MKENNTTHKAEELGKRSEVQNCVATRSQSDSVPQLTGEERYLESVMGFARGLKCSRDRDIARAARDWESTFDFRIRMTLQERQRRAKKRALRLQITAKPAKGTPTSSPSGVRIRVGVSPNQD